MKQTINSKNRASKPSKSINTRNKKSDEPSAFDKFKKKSVTSEDFKFYKQKDEKPLKRKTSAKSSKADNSKPVKKTVTKGKIRNSKGINELNEPIRLNKFLSESGVCARRKADELIKQGAVKVNGKIIIELGAKVLPSDFITVHGDPIPEKSRHIYIILNKPKDVITTTSDNFERKTVLDIVKKDSRIFPVGRLDRNTTGIILLTNDGELAHRLTHPSYEIERIYNVKLDKPLKFGDAQRIADGVELEDGKTAPCDVVINPIDATKVILTLTEGKNREVRRIFEEISYTVKQLERKFFAGLSLKGLVRGAYRHLEKSEIIALKKLVKLN